MKSTFQLIAAAACALALVACGGGSSKTADTTPAVVQPAFKSTDTVTGTGTVAANRDLVVVNYVGYLYDSTKGDLKGDKIDSSIDRNVPATFALGVGAALPGWDQGIVGMKVGGKRTLVIPASLAYGANARTAQPSVGTITYAAIPANSPLVYDVELVSVVTATAPVVITKTDTLVGTGAEAVTGKTLTVKYSGYLYDGSKPDFHGGVFDSSVIKGTTFNFVLGAGTVIAGWDQGVAGMKVGGKRILIVPPELGYGLAAQPAIPASNGTTFVAIPSFSTLVFEIELVGVK